MKSLHTITDKKNSPPYLRIKGYRLQQINIKDLPLLETVAAQFNIDSIRIESDHQLSVSGYHSDRLEELVSHLKPILEEIEPCEVGRIYTCRAGASCKYAFARATEIGNQIRKLKLSGPLPAHLKIAISGCKRCCTMPFVRDIGVTPVSPTHWNLIVGGNGGRNPRIGDVLEENIEERRLVSLVKQVLELYRIEADTGMRMAPYIAQTGIEHLRKKISQNSPF